MLDTLWHGFLLGISGYTGFSLLRWVTVAGWNRDNSDTSKERSGLIILTDHKTGVEYLTTLCGGLTRRVETDK